VAAPEQGERPHGADAARRAASAAVGVGRCPPAESVPPSCVALPDRRLETGWPVARPQQHASTSKPIAARLPAVTTRVQRNKNMAKLIGGLFKKHYPKK